MLSVEILGEPRLLLRGETCHLARRKARALVYYLASHDSPIRREKLLALLWPDLDRPEALRSLRVTLHNVHETIGGELVINRDALALSEDATVDARLLQRLDPLTADPALLKSTTDLYRGDFLDGFSLPDCPEFEDWLATERQRYRRLALEGRVATAELCEKRGHFAAALAALDSALDIDPFREDVQRACIRLHYLNGDRAGAIRRYSSLRKLLRDEMGVPPMPETRSLYDAVICDTLRDGGERTGTLDHPREKGRTAPNPRLGVQPLLPFVGRDAELRRLHALVADSQGRLALIKGEPGIGKTRLVEEVFRESGALAIAGVAHELERALPYQPVVEALRGLLLHPKWNVMDSLLSTELSPLWRSEIARLLPELTTASPKVCRPAASISEWYLWEAINRFLLAISRLQPLIVFLDDLHWADASTVGLLGYLVRNAANAPISFVATARPCSQDSPLATLTQALSREGRLVRLTLPRLRAHDLAAIASHLSPTSAEALSEWLINSSEGYPYVVVELVRWARESGILRAGGEIDEKVLTLANHVPQPIKALIEARLERLSQTTRNVLDAAVVIGKHFDFPLVVRVAALSENATIDGLDELQIAGLVRPLRSRQYTFDHSLTVEVAYRAISGARRQLLHRRVAEALESICHGSVQAVAGLLARHFGQSDTPVRGARYALRAANQARRLAAWTEASAFYHQALGISNEAGRVSILHALGNVHLQSGHSARAAEAYREAGALARGHGDIALAEYLIGSALMVERAQFAEFLCGTTPLVEAEGLEEIERQLRVADALARSGGTLGPAILASIKIALGCITVQQGDLWQAICHYRSALAIAEQAENRDATVHQLVAAHTNLGYYLLLANDPAAPEHARAAMRVTQERSLLAYQPYLHAILGEIALAADDLAKAEEHFTEGLAHAQQQTIPYSIPSLMAGVGRVAVRRGQMAVGVERLLGALARAESLHMRNKAAQIRLWLIPLLPYADAHAHLGQLRVQAKRGRSPFLREELGRLDPTTFA